MKLEARLLKLISIESVIRHEDEMFDFFLKQAQKLDSHQVISEGKSLLLWPKERLHDELILLAGHIDTVPISQENPPRIEGDRIYGLGSADMKAGLALMWELLEEPPESLAYDLGFIFYDGEEGNYLQNGLGPLLEKNMSYLKDIDLAICLEPTDNTIQLGCLGTINARAIFKGRSAHAARPWQGENAIQKAWPLLQKLDQYHPIDHGFDVDKQTLTYREVLSATLAEGGRAQNMIPDQFTVTINYRYPPGTSIEKAERFLKGFIGANAEIDIYDHCPAGNLPKDNSVFEKLKTATKAKIVAKQAWTDVGRFSLYGVDAINFGPAENAQCHQPDESTSIKMLHEGRELWLKFLRK